MIPKPRRGWFSYSLRTLFVLLTLFGIWLGMPVKWIRDRRKAMEHVEWVVDSRGARHRRIDWSMEADPSIAPAAQAPWSLRLLGEKPVQYINFRSDDPNKEAEFERLQRLFPEAQMGEWLVAPRKLNRRKVHERIWQPNS